MGFEPGGGIMPKVLKYILMLTLAAILSLQIFGYANWQMSDLVGHSERTLEHLELSEGTSLRIPILSQPRYLLPNATQSSLESGISTLIFDTLVHTDFELLSGPGIAHSWDYDEELITYRFYLRDNVYFHDGIRLDCEDVLFSFKAWIHPDYPGVRFNNFSKILGAEAYRNGESAAWPIPGLECEDPFTLVVQLTEPQRTFLPYAIGSSGIMPRHIYEPYLEKCGYDKLQSAGIQESLIGSGPYMFSSWSSPSEIELIRNETYWNGREVEYAGQIPMAGVEQLTFEVNFNPNNAFSRFLSNDVDLFPPFDGSFSENQYLEILDAAENGSVNYLPYTGFVYDYFHWNLRNPLFEDATVRKAICHAIDRDGLLAVTQPPSALSNGPTHPLRWDWNPSLADLHPEYDPAMTIALMESAGWTIEKTESGEITDGAVWTKTEDNGERLTMNFEIATNTGNLRRITYVGLIQETLAEQGFQTTTRTLPANVFYNDYLDGSHTFETAVAGWRLGTDPDQTSIFHTRSIDTAFNWMAYSNPEVDELLDEAIQIVDIDAAIPHYHRLQEILVGEDQAYCWLTTLSYFFATPTELIGFDPIHPVIISGSFLTAYIDGQGLPVEIAEETE